MQLLEPAHVVPAAAPFRLDDPVFDHVHGTHSADLLTAHYGALCGDVRLAAPIPYGPPGIADRPAGFLSNTPTAVGSNPSAPLPSRTTDNT